MRCLHKWTLRILIHFLKKKPSRSTSLLSSTLKGKTSLSLNSRPRSPSQQYSDLSKRKHQYSNRQKPNKPFRYKVYIQSQRPLHRHRIKKTNAIFLIITPRIITSLPTYPPTNKHLPKTHINPLPTFSHTHTHTHINPLNPPYPHNTNPRSSRLPKNHHHPQSILQPLPPSIATLLIAVLKKTRGPSEPVYRRRR